jgi:hypothetical protein
MAGAAERDGAQRQAGGRAAGVHARPARQSDQSGKRIEAPLMPPNKRPDADTVRRMRRLIALKYDHDPKRGMRGKPDRKWFAVRDLMRHAGQFDILVCAENLVRFDLMTESPNVGRGGRADSLPLEPGC